MRFFKPIHLRAHYAHLVCLAWVAMFWPSTAFSQQEYCFTNESSHLGLIATTSNCVPEGTPFSTPNSPYGVTGGYGFGYWTINGTTHPSFTMRLHPSHRRLFRRRAGMSHQTLW